MENGFRASMNWLHTWAGVTVGAVLFAIFWMGTLAVFDAEIDRWMIPETRLPAAEKPLPLDDLWQKLRPSSSTGFWSVTLPTERNPMAQLRFLDATGALKTQLVDPTTGQIVSEPTSLAGTGFIYPFHIHLHLRWAEIGYWLVGFCGMTMLALIASGVIIHRKIFADFFSLRFAGNRRRTILDLHNASGVLVLPFHVMITLSGLIIFLSIYYPGVRQVSYSGDDRAYYSEAFGTNSYIRAKRNMPGEMASLDAMSARARELWNGNPVNSVVVYHPGDAAAYVQIGHSIEFTLPYNRDRVYFDAASGEIVHVYEAVAASRVQRVIAGLHFIQFRHWTLRWLYFGLGLAGCLLIATGFLFWLESRRTAHGAPAPFGFRLVEGLTVGSVAGVILATLAFFVANRLLALGGAGRPDLEIWCFYLVWLAAYAYGWARPRRAWRDQSLAIALLAVFAVGSNWLGTGDHLVRSLAQRHLWAVAGMDMMLLTAAVIGLIGFFKLRAKYA